MTITQTVEIPANRHITLQVPREVPMGTTTIIIQFPIKEINQKKHKMTPEEEKEWFDKNSEWLNKEAMDVLEYQADIWGDDDE